MASSDILREMINKAPDQVSAIDNSIDQIDVQIADLDTQIDGVENGLCAVAESNLIAYLDGTKVPELEIIYGDIELKTGPTFGTIDYTTGNITDWQIIDSTTGAAVYEYLGVHWDGDLIVTELISNYAFGNDYLTRPLVPVGATYGLKPARANLVFAKGLLQTNANKIDASITVFEDYAS